MPNNFTALNRPDHLSPSPQEDAAWKAPLQLLAALPVPPEQSGILLNGCATPAQAALMADLLRDTPRESEPSQERLRCFLEIVDESAFSLREWVSALEGLYTFLRREGRDASFGMALGFVHCASEAIAASLSLTSLPNAVDEFLQENGFQG